MDKAGLHITMDKAGLHIIMDKAGLHTIMNKAARGPARATPLRREINGASLIFIATTILFYLSRE